jgi:hypothetical protein
MWYLDTFMRNLLIILCFYRAYSFVIDAHSKALYASGTLAALFPFRLP